jgi:hypothetical protein
MDGITDTLDELSAEYGASKMKSVAKDVATAQTKLEAMTQKAMKVRHLEKYRSFLKFKQKVLCIIVLLNSVVDH